MVRELEQAEMTQLYQDTSDELRRLLVRKLGNTQEAEEIAHDAYLKLCCIEHKKDIRDLRKYLFTMSVRLALNVLRKRKTERNYLEYESIREEHSHTVGGGSAYRVLLAELKLDVVKQALLELPGKTRQIFLLHRFEGLNYGQISDRMMLSRKAIEYHMGRALNKVTIAIEELAETDG